MEMIKYKILFTMTPPFNPNDGGVQRTTFKLGKKFTELGHEVFYFSLSNEGNIKADYGKLLHAMHRNRADNHLNLKELKKILNEVKPDFVINQMPYEVKLAKCLADERQLLNYVLLGCLRNSLFSVKNNIEEIYEEKVPSFLYKLIDHKLGYQLLLLLHRFRHRKQLKRILDLHDKFILLTPPNRKELNYFVGNYKNDKTLVIPNSIPFVEKNDTKKEQIILHVGRLNIAQKRSELLLEFWDKVYKQLEGWEFVIVGDGMYKEKMEQIIEEKKLLNIKLVGYQKPEIWYKKAPIFVMTSAFEGFPNVILEAQSYGSVPVAFNSYDALPWIVNDKQDAVLIEPFNIDQFSSAVMRLVKDVDTLEQMNKKAKLNASKFVIDAVSKKWIALFDELNR